MYADKLSTAQKILRIVFKLKRNDHVYIYVKCNLLNITGNKFKIVIYLKR